MKMSTENQFKGVIASINEGLVNSEIDVELDNGNFIAAVITNSAVESLGLERDAEAIRITSYNVCYTKLLRSAI